MEWGEVARYIAAMGLGSIADFKPFDYTTDAIALDNGANVKREATLQLMDMRPFVWTHGLYKCDNATVMGGADTLFGGFLLKFTNLGGGVQLSNREAPIETRFSRCVNGSGPRPLVYPIVIGGSATISMDVINKTGGNVNLYLTFVGLVAK